VNENNLALGRRLYAALNEGDTATLTDILDEDFVGDLTPGLPEGFGSHLYEGRDAMMSEGWGRVGQFFTMGPQPEEIIATDGYIIGRGDYVGSAVATGTPVRARFAHFWTVVGGRVTRVQQVTDSAAWAAGLS
jgi:2-(1,2-epoxy-1,2-dihydrophenyl)acetyl-CoA isomerase